MLPPHRAEDAPLGKRAGAVAPALGPSGGSSWGRHGGMGGRGAAGKKMAIATATQARVVVGLQ